MRRRGTRKWLETVTRDNKIGYGSQAGMELTAVMFAMLAVVVVAADVLRVGVVLAAAIGMVAWVGGSALVARRGWRRITAIEATVSAPRGCQTPASHPLALTAVPRRPKHEREPI